MATSVFADLFLTFSKITPGTGATATATIGTSPSPVTALSLGAGGSGYTNGATLTITGGGGSGATGTVQVSTAGVVTGVTLTAGGTGYTTAPTVAIVSNLVTVPTTVNVNNVLYATGKEGNVTLNLVGGSTLNTIESLDEIIGV